MAKRTMAAMLGLMLAAAAMPAVARGHHGGHGFHGHYGFGGHARMHCHTYRDQAGVRQRVCL